MSEGGEISIGLEEIKTRDTTEPNKRPEAPETGKVDARDYFPIGMFQKRAETIDPDETHPWTMVHDIGFMAESSYGAIVAGKTTTENPFGLLIAEETSDGQKSSVFIRNLNSTQIDDVMDVIHTIAPSLPDVARHQFIRKIIQNAPFLNELKDGEVIVAKLGRMGLEFLSDYVDNDQDNNQASTQIQWPEVKGKAPTNEQQTQLTEYARLVAGKMPKSKFAERMKELLDNLIYIDDPYGRNYPTIFTQLTEWVLSEREDTMRNYSILQRKEPKEYTIKDKVTRPINSEEALRTALSLLPPPEPMPDTRNMRRLNEAPEMVQLDKVVGGNNIEEWSLSTSEGRGLPQMLNLALAFQKGNASVTGRGGNEPIRLIKVGNKYYVEGDGRHRVAVLKALGVAEIPAMVTPFEY